MMKKTLIVIAALVVGVSVFAQVKPMKAYGPATLENTIANPLLDYAMFNKDVIGVYEGTTNLLVTMIKPNTDPTKNKEQTAWIPKGYNADNTTWDYATDVAPGGNIQVIGFKSKNVFLLVAFNNGDVRIYSVTLKGASEGRSASASKINGSTAVLAGYNASSVSSGKCYLDDGAGTVTQYDKNMVAKTQAAVTGAIGVTLPTDKDQYTYDVDATAGVDVQITANK